MKVSLNWIKDYINIDASAEEIAERLTGSGLEVEGLEKVESIPGGLEGIVIGEVLTCRKHENADKLSVTTVDLGGDEPTQIVCGAPNVAAGQKVVVATVGAILYPEGEEPFKIKKAKIRGEASSGMICAEDELGLGNSHDGIIVLDTDLLNGTPASEHFDIETDFVIEIGLTPNRADATGAYGVARDIKALYEKELTAIDTSEFSVDETTSKIEVDVQNTEACKRYAGLSISGVKVEESPSWLKNRLQSIGVASINNVVDITNYILHDLGQPLHAFDAKKITSNKVVVGTLAEGTKFTTLDEIERKLFSSDLMISNDQEPMCIAGVFGGIDSGVSNDTTDVFLESAYFSPDWVRKSAMQHTLKTDASFRFERGCDPNMVITALKKAAIMIKEIAGGKVTSDIIDYYPEEIENFSVEVSFQRVNELIGQDIPEDKVRSILKHLEIEIVSEQEGVLSLSIPPYRVDVQREADVIEDILRIYGFDNIEIDSDLSSKFLSPLPKNDLDKKRKEISQILSARGYSEIFSNSLTKAGYTAEVEGINAEENVNILNKLSEDLGIMRRSMLFSALEAANHNINRKQKNLKLYEFGKTYSKVEGEFVEKSHLSILLTGDVNDESWRTNSAEVQYHDISSAVLDVCTKLGLDKIKSEKLSNDLYVNGLTLKSKKNEFATIGQVSAAQAKKAGVTQVVWFADLDLDFLLDYEPKTQSFKEISKFPEVRRDLSLVIDKKVTYSEIVATANQVENRILQQVNVFDTFEGEQVGEGKKSYSVSFILNDSQQTLTEKQIDKTMQKLINAFKKQLDAIIRE